MCCGCDPLTWWGYYAWKSSCTLTLQNRSLLLAGTIHISGTQMLPSLHQYSHDRCLTAAKLQVTSSNVLGRMNRKSGTGWGGFVHPKGVRKHIAWPCLGLVVNCLFLKSKWTYKNSCLTSKDLHAVFKADLLARSWLVIAWATWSQMYLGLLRQSCVQLGANKRTALLNVYIAGCTAHA